MLDAVTARFGQRAGVRVLFHRGAGAGGARARVRRQPRRARLALGTFRGAAELAARSSEPPATLRAQVTSKGGTTERALATMRSGRVDEAILRAVRAANERARELGDELGSDPL